MDVEYPKRYHIAAAYFDSLYGDIETNTTLDNEHKLMFYALRRQSDNGPCTLPAPPFWHMTERHKYNAWKKISEMPKPEAMVHFVRQFEDYLGEPVRWVEKRLPDTTVTVAHCDGNLHGATAATEEACEGDKELLSCQGALTQVLPDTLAQHDTSNIFTVDSPKAEPKNSDTVGSGDRVAPSYLIASVTDADDGAEWHDDLRAHAAPTEQNVRYLVSQVMHARRLYCEQAKCVSLQDSQKRALPAPNPVTQSILFHHGDSSMKAPDSIEEKQTLTNSARSVRKHDGNESNRCLHFSSLSTSDKSEDCRSSQIQAVSPRARKVFSHVPSDIFNV